MTSSQLISVGLLGYGTSGRFFHAPFLQHLHDKYSLDVIFERTSSFCKELVPSVLHVRTLSDLLTSSVEMIIVCTPPEFHYDHALSVIQSGKHCIVEKPFTVTYTQAISLINMAEQYGVFLSVYQNRRWDSDYLTLFALLNNEQYSLGQLEKVEMHFDRYRPVISTSGKWNEQHGHGHGELYSLGSHLLDQAIQLFGKPKSILQAEVEIQRKGCTSPDYFAITLEYDNNLTVLLTAGCCVVDPSLKYLVVGSKGIFEKHGQDVQERMLRVDGKRPSDDDGNEDTEWGKEPSSQDGWIYDPMLKTTTSIKTLKGNYGQFYTGVFQGIKNVKEGRHSMDNNSAYVDPKDTAYVIQMIESINKCMTTQK